MAGLKSASEKTREEDKSTENKGEVAVGESSQVPTVPLSNDARHEKMRHQEIMSHDSVVRAKANTVKTITILLIIALVFGFAFWFFTHGVAKQDDISARVDKLIEKGEFDAARDEARKLKSRGDTVANFFQYRWEARRLLQKIDREEKEWNLANHITVGRSSASFKGIKYTEARDHLIKQGFEKRKIKLTEIAYDNLTRKQKKWESGTVIDISINGDKRFGEKEQFSPNSVIEIYYTGKNKG